MKIKAIDRKLLRDLWRVRSMGLAISAVVASGIALLVAALGCFESLETTRSQYYARTGFADVFAGAKRAPEWLAREIDDIPGVERSAVRVVVDVALDVPGMSEPVNGRLISIPDRGRPVLNNILMRRGRWPDRERAEEAIVSERFAEAHGLGLGASVAAVINGRRQRLEIVGIALSPEYVYAISPGEMVPDPKRFGLFWMTEKHLATAFDMEGGFNDVSLSLAEGAGTGSAIAELDRILGSYGGFGAVPRALQTSNWYLQNELNQLQGMALILPMIFLGVAVFLLNVVLRRMIAVQREQIAALKALGYSNYSVGLHYIQWAAVVSLLGGGVGIVIGIFLSDGMLGMYADFFRFPFLLRQWSWSNVLVAALACLAAAALGAVAAVRSAVRLPPAEAMRPAPPEKFRVSLFERLGLRRWLSQPARMILRNFSRRPLRAVASITGIAFSAAIMVMAGASIDSLNRLIDIQFNVIQRQDVTVALVEPAGRAALHELASVPGVMRVEPTFAVPVRIRNGPIDRQVSIQGFASDASLQRVVGADFRPIDLDRGGLVLSQALADVLGVAPGDAVRVEALLRARPERDMVVSGTVDDLLGVSAYMEPEELARFVRGAGTTSGAALRIDPLAEAGIYESLKAMPWVAGVALRSAVVDNFRKHMSEGMGAAMFINLIFAVIIAFGVIYNTARVSLSETSRELASMRVMGFTRAEISTILLGELGLLTLVSIPVGLLLGYSMLAALLRSIGTELFRFPLELNSSTFLWASAAVSVAMAVSAWIVRRKLHRLDLVAVLKTRE